MNEITRPLEKIEMEINFYKGQAVQSFFEVGERLIEAKKIVPHGEWEKWLEERVDFSDRRARQLMQVTREFGNRQMSSVLTLDKMLLLTTVNEQETKLS